MTVHECVSFLLIQDDKILLEKRSKDKNCDPGLIAIPGGHMEKGENQIQTLNREIGEELGVMPTRPVYLCSLYHPTTELQLIHFYVINTWIGDITAYEAEEVFWCKFDQFNADAEVDKIVFAEYLRLSNSSCGLF